MAFHILLILGLCLSTLGLEVELNSDINLLSQTKDLIKGTFKNPDSSINFVSTSNSLSVFDETSGALIISFFDFDTHFQVHFARNSFLFSNNGQVMNVVEVEKLNPAYSRHNNYLSLLKEKSNQQLMTDEANYISSLREFVASQYAHLLIDLSFKLAELGISGASHPSSLPIHMPAMLIFKARKDIVVNPAVLARVNSKHSAKVSLAQRGNCTLANVCKNPCFGLCGPDCTCWSFVCGDCNCWKGCQQHDCCCSCQGIFTACCLNVIQVKCVGYNNTCRW